MPSRNYSNRFDQDKLRKMITEGKKANEIIFEFRTTPYTLLEQLIMLQELDQKIYIIKGLFDHPENDKQTLKTQGIVFHEAVLDKIGFKPGDALVMKAIGNRIILENIRDS